MAKKITSRSRTQDVKVSGLVEQIVSALKKKGYANVMELGTFRLVKRKNHKYTDFRTKKSKVIPAISTVTFQSAKRLRDLVK